MGKRIGLTWSVWQKKGIQQDFLKEEFKAFIDQILNFKHIRSFTLKIFLNNLSFRNVTGHWKSHTNICITCTRSRAHFVQCGTHNLLLEQVVTKMEKVDLVKDFSCACFFFDHQEGINHPSNVILISTLHFIYTLRYTLTPPNLDLIKSQKY